MGVEGNIQVMDAEMIMENCPIMITTLIDLQLSSSYGVGIKETCIMILAKSGSTKTMYYCGYVGV